MYRIGSDATMSPRLMRAMQILIFILGIWLMLAMLFFADKI